MAATFTEALGGKSNGNTLPKELSVPVNKATDDFKFLVAALSENFGMNLELTGKGQGR